MSLKNKLYNYINGYETRDDLRYYGQTNNYDTATVDRKLRELTNEGKIKPEFNGKYIKGYHKISRPVCFNQKKELEELKIFRTKDGGWLEEIETGDIEVMHDEGLEQAKLNIQEMRKEQAKQSNWQFE